MSEEVLDHTEAAAEQAAPLTNGEMVHWMAKKPIRVGAGGLSAAAAGGFVLGAATAVAALALMGWIGPERRLADFDR
ncbi:hypothetical protein [Phenylobacterium sp.]|jgi:hypothetical protein|uniref:hypothetical protein n=1 Tax=Phenylobacterium sp. TaxID=1871053 RepID=UPI002F414752